MKQPLTLKQRILMGYLVPLLLMLGAALVIYMQTQRVQDLSAKLTAAGHQVVLAKEAHVHFTQFQRDMRGYVLSAQRSYLDTAQQKLIQGNDELKALATALTSPQARVRLEGISAAVVEMRRVADDYRKLIDAGRSSEAAKVFKRSNLGEISARIDTLIDEIEADELRAEEQLIAEQIDATNSLVAVALGSALAAMVIAVVMGRVLASRLVGTIGDSVAQISSSSTEMAATMDEYERTVRQQVAAVSQVSATVEELGMSARQSANQAESSAAAAMHALELAEQGARSAADGAQSTASMKNKIDALARQILNLSEQAGQIGSIAKLVGELASETNMLALNAAVEAARAGEQGKGFAVVATEIRKLAAQSKKSAERADSLVMEIQKATNSAVMITEDGSRSADEVMATARRVAEAFDAIAGAANGVAENAQQVTLNSKQQAAALSQVTDAMQSLAAGSRQMAAGTEQTKVGIENLRQVACELKAVV